MRVSETNENETSADADLVLRSRSGDADAFGELWARHAAAATRAARAVSPDRDADEIVSEAYATVFHAIGRGGGPTGSFRAYLFTAIRAVAGSSDGETDAALEGSLTVAAFRGLPSRWQEALWYTEVDGRKASEIAPLLGLDQTEAAQLAFRARGGLRDAWIRANAASVPDESECRWTDERLGARSRGNLGARDAARAEAHIATCPRCAVVAAEADEVGSRLPLVLLPLALGVNGAAGYLAAHAHEDDVATAPMPDAVVATAGASDAATPELAGPGAELFGRLVEPGAALAAGAAAAPAASPPVRRGMLSVAGMVTAGTCSLAIAAVIAAAAVLPGHFGAGDASASFGDSAAAAEIEPDARLAAHSEQAEEPAVPAPTPEPPETKTPKNKETPAPDDGASNPSDDAEASDPAPDGDAAGAGKPTEHPAPSPSETTKPTDPPKKDPEFKRLELDHAPAEDCDADACIAVTVTGTAGQDVQIHTDQGRDETTVTLKDGSANATIGVNDSSETVLAHSAEESSGDNAPGASAPTGREITISVTAKYVSEEADPDETSTSASVPVTFPSDQRSDDVAED